MPTHLLHFHLRCVLPEEELWSGKAPEEMTFDLRGSAQCEFLEKVAMVCKTLKQKRFIKPMKLIYCFSFAYWQIKYMVAKMVNGRAEVLRNLKHKESSFQISYSSLFILLLVKETLARQEVHSMYLASQIKCNGKLSSSLMLCDSERSQCML